MKLLLDNCVHKHCKRLLPGHQVLHASEVGMSRLQNGDLLAAAAAEGFEALITVDQNMQHQQPLDRLPVPVLVLDTRDTRLAALQAMSPHFETALAATLDHVLVILDQPGHISCAIPRDPAAED